MSMCLCSIKESVMLYINTSTFSYQSSYQLEYLLSCKPTWKIQLGHLAEKDTYSQSQSMLDN